MNISFYDFLLGDLLFNHLHLDTIHLQLLFVYGVTEGQKLSFSHGYQVVPTPFIKMTIISLLYDSFVFVTNELYISLSLSFSR